MHRFSYVQFIAMSIANFSINIKVRRLGGAYGAKISRATQIACACALVCYKLNRPARFIMTIESNMRAVGKRYDTRQEYEAGVDASGRIQYLNSKYWGNSGCNFNEYQAPFISEHMKRYVDDDDNNNHDNGKIITTIYLCSCYDTSSWTFVGLETKTNIPSNTYCRAPGA